MNEQFPSEIENRRKALYPEAKRARQNKNNEVKLVRDKLYINGRQFIPKASNDQPYSQQNASGYNNKQTYRRFQTGFGRHNTIKQQSVSFSNNTNKQ